MDQIRVHCGHESQPGSHTDFSCIVTPMNKWRDEDFEIIFDRSAFTTTETLASSFFGLVQYNLLMVHLACCITCFFREMFESSVHRFAQFNRLFEVFSFAFYFQGVVRCIYLYVTWIVLHENFEVVSNSLGELSTPTLHAFAI